ncbi:hypothetical protein DB31_4436 [Hyalangium minutum]|uniref:Uncharacterized protein n=2 Tax=Hyalangium minutum TaxID=394096 RepID=A0A085W2T0_9BACT|nr:hypothetical protein DB31_4436 [Hyalangium minutum]
MRRSGFRSEDFMSSNGDASSKQGRNNWMIVPNPFIVPNPSPNPGEETFERTQRKPTAPPSKPPLAR